MINIRVNQLKRKLNSVTPTLQNKETQDIANLIMQDFDNEVFSMLFGHLNQIPLLGQIFSRAMAQIATDESSEDILYQIQILERTADLLIMELSETPMNFPIDIHENIQLNAGKLRKVQDRIAPIRKQRNKNLTTIEKILKFTLSEARMLYPKISLIKSWDQLLSFVFSTDVEDESKGVSKLEQIHIKEQILANQLEGALIKQISEKYDGILAYSMSLLTMLTNSKFNASFTPQLNEILEKISGSTTMILLQGRLNNVNNERTHLKTSLDELKSKIILDIKTNPSAIPPFQVKKALEKLKYPLNFDPDSQIPRLSEFPDIYRLIKLPPIIKEYNLLNEIWEKIRANFQEFISTLKEILVFFNKIIFNTNDITARLFSKGFQAAIPLQDINTCEKAGIHIKDICSTSSTQKVKISDEIIYIKTNFLRKYETELQMIMRILNSKVNEESAFKTRDDQWFRKMKDIFRTADAQMNARGIFQGVKEEAILASRMLYTSLLNLRRISNLLKLVEKMPYNSENQEFFEPIINEIQVRIPETTLLNILFKIVSTLMKNMWSLDRKMLITISLDPEYIKHPEKIQEIVKSIPMTLKREMAQRLITKEKQREKNKKYEAMMQTIDALKMTPESIRSMLEPYDEEKYHLFN